jgi:hypothetical protein
MSQPIDKARLAALEKAVEISLLLNGKYYEKALAAINTGKASKDNAGKEKAKKDFAAICKEALGKDIYTEWLWKALTTTVEGPLGPGTLGW